MENEKKGLLLEFAAKAAQRLEDKKVTKYTNLYIPSLEQEIKIRSLTRQEIYESMNMDESEDEPDKSDNYCIYLAVVEPSLKDVAKELKSQGKIVEYTEVCNIFDMHERVSIVQEVMKLSGVTSGGKKVKVVESIKN